LYGLEDDLNMGPNQYQLAVSLLFVTYVVSVAILTCAACADARLDIRNSLKHGHQEAATREISRFIDVFVGPCGHIFRFRQQLRRSGRLQALAWDV
jgi:hypothetical protein